MKVDVWSNILLFLSLSHMCMAVLLLGGKKMIPRWGRGGWERRTLPLSFLLDFNLYPLSHIRFPRLLWLVTELCIVTRSSRGEDWYNIKPPPRIIKQRAWALNEGWWVEEYIIILSLSHMCMALLLLGAQEIDSKMGVRWMGKEIFAPPRSSLWY